MTPKYDPYDIWTMSVDPEIPYRKVLELVYHSGLSKSDRTNTGTRSIFSPPPMKFNLQYWFPLLTSKRVPWKSLVAETLWYLQGRNDLKSLRDDGCTWWDEWELEDGTIGKGYGYQLRHWTCTDGTEFDQLNWIINEIKTNPDSRRLLWTNWNAGEVDEMALPPCHGVVSQFYVQPDGVLDLAMYQRSGDMFLGVPTNISMYSLICHIVAAVTGLKPGTLTLTLGDAHIYNNHITQVEEFLGRSPRTPPTLTVDALDSVDAYRPENIHLEGYNPLPSIKAPVAV